MNIILCSCSFLLLVSCTGFSKIQGSNEMSSMVKEVLDEDQGIHIKFEPMPKVK